MSIILNIDTSIETASVSIAKDGVIIASINNAVQKEHAAFLHLAIKEVQLQASLELKQLDAIAVTKGPGSYTGLRVGMASAKGLCYALNKPLITVGTLNALALAAIDVTKEKDKVHSLFCPMIDARRMEVYTAVFDKNMNEILGPCAMILNEDSFSSLLQTNNIFFSGSGALKWSKLISSTNASFIYDTEIALAINHLSYTKLLNKEFTDLTYSEPMYIKDFFSA